ncbi:hypothetical protein I317_06785 [Kwoniella heveanensis CBS 569]|nr:hypothetical protein I317_06785 [Kwoniella heveanensis CBS 569]
MTHYNFPNLRHRHRRDQAPVSSSSSFSVTDSSPLFSYGSSAGSSSSSTSFSPWTAGYALQSDGFDETLHLTAQSNSTISFNLSACASTSQSTSETIPFSLYNLPWGIHDVLWNSGTIASGEQVIFWGIVADRPLESSSLSNVTIDDAYVPGDGAGVGLKFEGNWTHLGPSVSSTSLVESEKITGNFNKTLAVTQGKGSSVTFSGAGSAMYVYGTVGPDYGSASVAMNGNVIAPALNLTSPWQMTYELLWFQTGLDPAQNNKMVMTNLGDKKMTIDFIILTTDPDTMSKLVLDDGDSFVSTLAGKLVLFLGIPLLVIVFISLLTLWILRKRRSQPTPRRRSRRRSHDSSWTLHPSSLGSSYAQSAEKHHRRDTLGSGHSIDSFDNVFISYDEARTQRMSDRWHNGNSPLTPGTGADSIDSHWSPRSAGATSAGMSSHFAQRSAGLGGDSNTSLGLGTNLPALPENVVSSPERIRSLLGSNYTATNPPDSRRGTALPAYTPEGTYVTAFTGSSADSGNGSSPVNAYETLTGGTSTNTSGFGFGSSAGLYSGGGNGLGAIGAGTNQDPATRDNMANTTTTTAPSLTGSPASRYPTAEEEKAAQLHLFRDIAQSQSQTQSQAQAQGSSGVERTSTSATTSTPAHGRHQGEDSLDRLLRSTMYRGDEEDLQRASTIIAPSEDDIISIFGAPGSDRRLSAMTDFTSVTGATGIAHTPNAYTPSPFPFGAQRQASSSFDEQSPPPPPSGPSSLSLINGSNSSFSPLHVTPDRGVLTPPTRPTVDTAFLNTPFNPHNSLHNKHPFFISPNTASNPPLAMSSSVSSSSRRTSQAPPSTWTGSATTPSSHTQSQTQAQTPTSRGRGDKHGRTQSSASAWTVKSAARPDSAIIPFENFINRLNAAAREEEARDR